MATPPDAVVAGALAVCPTELLAAVVSELLVQPRTPRDNIRAIANTDLS
jgi:hypothetical protein